MPRNREPTRRGSGPIASEDAALRAVDAVSAGPKARMDADTRRRLGRDLRLLYASVLNQPLPERLIRLVDELAAMPVEEREGPR